MKLIKVITKNLTHFITAFMEVLTSWL